jgi:DAK2 domain fusion protein YloV
MNQQHISLCDGPHLLSGLQAAAHWLEQHVGEVNALNVFPVPDGDTGTNMHLTISAAVSGVEPQPSASSVAEQIYRKALMGARGNSGVILSQIIRGFAEGVAGKHELDGPALGAALHQAAERAYKAVMRPTEGTILTVARVAGEHAERTAADGADWIAVLEAAVAGAEQAVAETPNQLKQLRDAGVVDAGGKGLHIVLQGFLKYARGEEIQRETGAAPVEVAFNIEEMHTEDDEGYCTTFLVEGEHIPFEQVRETIAGMGTSVVVVGDETLVKAHVHTLRPGDVLNYAVEFGALMHIEIANMDMQKAAIRSTGKVSSEATRAPKESSNALLGDKGDANSEMNAPEPVAPIGIVAVAPGSGFADLFRSLNVGKVVTGGQTMNPSTQDLVEAILEVPQKEVIVLPNNSNILMAARQAQEVIDGDKMVRVVPSKTLPQGMIAMLAFNYNAELDANAEAMTRALGNVRTFEITTAVRDAIMDDKPVRAGQTIGLLDDNLVEAGDDRDAVIDALFEHIDMDDYEIVTLYYGANVDEERAQALADRITNRYDYLDTVEVQHGGQPFYDFVISVE